MASSSLARTHARKTLHLEADASEKQVRTDGQVSGTVEAHKRKRAIGGIDWAIGNDVLPETHPNRSRRLCDAMVLVEGSLTVPGQETKAPSQILGSQKGGHRIGANAIETGSGPGIGHAGRSSRHTPRKIPNGWSTNPQMIKSRSILKRTFSAGRSR
jgi:hypothetical protein